MEINYKDIGIRIKQERFNQNITQEKLAEISGISITHMSNIENANTKLSLPVLVNIANALNCDANIILFGNTNSNWEKIAIQYGLSRSSIEYMRPAFSLNPIE